MSEEAQIINIAELLNEKIGVEDDRVQSDKDLKEALKMETPNTNLFSIKGEDEVEEVITEEPPIAPIVTEDNKEVVEEVIEPIIQSDQTNIYHSTLKTMFGDSITHIIEEDENGNEVEKPISEVNLDENTFKQLVQNELNVIKEEANKDKISLKGISSFARDLVEIDRNGGNISELLKVKETYSDPLLDLDLTEETDQMKAVYLRMMAGGNDEDTTKRLIDSYKSEGILESKALQAKAELDGAVKQQVEQAKIQANEQAKATEALFKSYKKEIKTSLDRYELNDNVKTKIVTSATKRNDDGRFEMDRLYKEIRENPESAADLALFMLDKEEYDRQVTNKKVTETKLTTARKIKIMKEPSNNGPSLQGDKGKSDNNFVPIESLNN